MLLEEIGSTLWNLDLFQNTRSYLEKSTQSGWLKPVRERFWDSDIIGRVTKIFIKATSYAVDGVVVAFAIAALLKTGVATRNYFILPTPPLSPHGRFSLPTHTLLGVIGGFGVICGVLIGGTYEIGKRVWRAFPSH